MLTNRIDKLGASLLPILYLFAAIIATGWYFTDGRSTGLVGIVAVGQMMAWATELHSFLTQRRVVIAYRLRQKGRENDFSTQFRVLCALVAFQMFTSIGYTAATWHGAWWEIAIRGAAIPVLFLLSGLAVPIDLDVGEMLQRKQYQMTVNTANVVTRQQARRLRNLGKSDRNLAPVLVAMLNQEGDNEAAERIRNIDQALGTVESGMDARDDTLSVIVSGPGDDDDPPPHRIAPPQVALSEPSAKRQIRHLLEQDFTMTPRQLEMQSGLAYSTCNKYYHEIMDEWNIQEVPRERKRA